MTPDSFALKEGFESHASRRKRMGQYFSGPQVAKLILAMASQRTIHSVLDPMCGTGDMLAAARSIIPTCKQLDGIEIDPIAHTQCQASTKNRGKGKSTILIGSAFDPSVLSNLQHSGYDLVVTNPPYVRYQAQKKSAGLSATLPSAVEVRLGLQACLEQLTTLDPEDKAAFLALAKGYSGLSDLAVPSWLLCAALVKPGGTLAMVVPEAWLNRDYASVIRYLLLRWFRIEYVVEDTHAAWFPGTLIKTTLMIAQRVPRRVSVMDWGDETYLEIGIPNHLANKTCLIGTTAFGLAPQPEKAFAIQAKAVLAGERNELAAGLPFQRVLISDQARTALRMAKSASWLARLETNIAPRLGDSYRLSSVVATWCDTFRKFTTLESLGLDIGQGLRTGANDFFYVDVERRASSTSKVKLSKRFRSASCDVPSSCIRPVVRKQSDVRDQFRVDPDTLVGAVLAFQNWALSEDAQEAGAKPLPPCIEHHLRLAATTEVAGVLIPKLTAVAPNVRKANPRTGTPARFWYMLPAFAPRHSPDLFLARVNTESPRVIMNPARRVLVDANFSTLWLRPDAKLPLHAFLAILNSSIALALYEYSGAVMGGGALKLEATHLRSLPIPRLSPKTIGVLASLGEDLAGATNYQRQALIEQIDQTICTAMFGMARTVEKLAALKAIIKERQGNRLMRL